MHLKNRYTFEIRSWILVRKREYACTITRSFKFSYYDMQNTSSVGWLQISVYVMTDVCTLFELFCASFAGYGLLAATWSRSWTAKKGSETKAMQMLDAITPRTYATRYVFERAEASAKEYDVNNFKSFHRSLGMANTSFKAIAITRGTNRLSLTALFVQSQADDDYWSSGISFTLGLVTQ